MIIKSAQILKFIKKNYLHTFLKIIPRLCNLDTWPSVYAKHLPNWLTNSTSAGALGWRFYNSKNPIPNESASLFGKITIRTPLQWLQDLMLDGTLATILRPIPLENKMSLPTPKAQQEDQIPAATRLLSLLRLLLHFLFSLSRTPLQNSWRHLWSQPKLGTGSKQNLKNNHLRLDLWRPIQGSLIWIAIIFISNVKIISKLQALSGWIVLHLQPHFSVALSGSDGLSTSTAIRAPLQSRGQNLKPSSKRTSGILRLFLTAFGISLERTPSISWKRPKTGHHTFSIFNLSWQNLIVLGPQMN